MSNNLLLSELEIMQVIAAIDNTNFFSKKKINKHIFEKLIKNEENIKAVWDCYLSKVALTDITTINKIDLNRDSLLKHFIDFSKIFGLTILTNSSLQPAMRDDEFSQNLKNIELEIFVADITSISFTIIVEKNLQELIVSIKPSKILTDYDSIRSIAIQGRKILTLERHSVRGKREFQFTVNNSLLQDKSLTSIEFSISEKPQSHSLTKIFQIDL